MRDALHRLLVAFTGMPDEPLRGCTGSCSQGHEACDCEIGAWIPPDAERVIQPPTLDPRLRARILRRSAVLAVAAGSLLAALIGISDPHFTP